MKPLARGYIDQVALFIACIACLVLIVESHGARALTANIIYSLTLIGMYAVSAIYYCHHWSHRVYLVIKRFDYAAIFFLIAGTATPICLLGLKANLGLPLLLMMWLFAALGMFVTLFWVHAPKWFRACIYVIFGWLAVPFVYEIESALGIINVCLLLIGGIVYTLGALIYAFKWPNPFPRLFGYHELFHLFVVIASGFHFAVIYSLSTA